MKLTLTIVVLLVAATVASAQTSNIHASATLGTSINLGYSNPSVGATVGGDLRKGRFDLSSTMTLMRVRKNVGGDGHSLAGRMMARWYVTRRVFVAGGIDGWHYRVRDYAKHGVNVLGGVGYARGNAVYSVTYAHEAWEVDRPSGTSSRTCAVAGEAQYFLHHHIYFDVRVAVQRFTSQRHPMTGLASEISVGVWR